MERTIKIFYEDNHIIVVYKPKGVLSQADGTGKSDMLTILKEYIKNKYDKPGNVYLGLVHRLDLYTSGIMVFAKTSKAASRLSKQVSNHLFQKKYLAIIEGKIDSVGILKNNISKNEEQRKSYISPTGKETILEYKLLEYKNNLSLVDINLKTGRFHQIRCQFSFIGHPLYGDIKYGSKNKIDNLNFPLEAYYLSFFHPITNEKLEYEYKTLHL